MIEDLFETAWARVDRADELRLRMAETWNAYIETEPFTTSLDGEGDGVYILRLSQVEPLPSELAIATGEWLYNVRSALDYLIWATAAHVTGQLPPPDEGQLQYPIYDEEAAWNRNIYRLKHLADHHRSMLKTMQPFNSNLDANYLGWINRLARIDRHRHLSHMTAYLAVIEPVIAVPDGCRTTLQWGERIVSEATADVARIVVTPWREDMEVQVNPRLGIDPEIAAWSGSDFWRRVRYSERFHLIQLFVSAEIAVYEYDCVGRSRGMKFLTEDYKAECDARRPSNRPYPTRVRQPVTWTEPREALDKRALRRHRFPGELAPSRQHTSAAVARKRKAENPLHRDYRLLAYGEVRPHRFYAASEPRDRGAGCYDRERRLRPPRCEQRQAAAFRAALPTTRLCPRTQR